MLGVFVQCIEVPGKVGEGLPGCAAPSAGGASACTGLVSCPTLAALARFAGGKWESMKAGQPLISNHRQGLPLVGRLTPPFLLLTTPLVCPPPQAPPRTTGLAPPATRAAPASAPPRPSRWCGAATGRSCGTWGRCRRARPSPRPEASCGGGVLGAISFFPFLSFQRHDARAWMVQAGEGDRD